jgi:anti-sigma B factor antagonist
VTTSEGTTDRIDLSAHIVAEDAAPGVCTLRIKDALLNYAMGEDLKRGLVGVCRARVGAGTRGFVFDLSRVSVMDSGGLSALISVKKLVEEQGGRMSLFALSPMIRRLFELTKLDRVFEIHDSEAQALSALTPSR